MSEKNTIQNEQSSAQIITALQNENAFLKEELAELQQQMAWLKKQMLGRKTEQTSVIMDGGTQLSLFGDAQPESASAQEETVTVPKHKRKKKRTHGYWMNKLPIEEIEYRKEHPVCDHCGAEMKEISKDMAYDELVYTPAFKISNFKENHHFGHCYSEN